MAHPLLRGTGAALLTCLAGCGLFGDPVYRAPPEPELPEPLPVTVDFTGNEEFGAFRLRRLVEDRMIDLSRAPDSETVVQDAAFDIEDRYRAEGYPDVVVDWRVERVERDGAEGVHVVFDVQEGPQVTVADLDLPGRAPFPRDDLLRFWLRRGSGTLGLGDPLFVESDVLGFAETLRVFYRTSGYLVSEVADPVIRRFVEDGEHLADIEITITPGPLYRIRSATVAPELQATFDAGEVDPPVGEDAAAATVEAFRRAVLAQVRRNGHPEAIVSVELSRDDAATAVDVHVVGEPGRRATIGEVRVSGNRKTSSRVVLRHFDLESGDVYDGTEVDETLRELYLTGLFRRVEIQHEWRDPDGEGPGIVDLEVAVVEEPSQAVEVLGGWGSYERLRGKVRYEEANLFGTGRDFVAEALASTKGYRGSLTVIDPALFGTRNVLSVTLDGFKREEPSFIDRAVGGTVAVSRALAERWDARVGYTFRERDGAQSDVIDPAAALANFTEGSLFAELRHDARDSLLYPRSGYQFAVQVDGNDPALGSDVQFLRASFTGSFYVPLSRSVGLAFRSSQGWLWPGEGSDRVPIQVRWFNGGESTVRSFRESRIGPSDPNDRPLGGEYRNVFAAELRARLIATLEGALFADAGNLGSDVTDYGFSNMRYAVGAGLRLALPIGPVRVDAAYNPDREHGENEWTVHLSVGYPF